MSARSIARPLCRFLRQRRALTTTRACYETSELSPASSSREGRRALDVGKIWQAQGNSDSTKADETLARQYEVLDKCPDPRCPCAAMPPMPDGLPIDTTSKMSMPYYDRHVLISAQAGSSSSSNSSSSGDDVHALALQWPSKIESDPAHLATILKEKLGPKGAQYRPDFSVSITASTLSAPVPASSTPDADECDELWLFPDFVRFRARRGADASSAVAAAVASSTPLQLQPGSDNTWSYTRVTKPVILICGHGSRDARCGILGPLLLAEFERCLGRGASTVAATAAGGSIEGDAHVALVSHIGGHKFAGNVVLYMPPGPAQAPQFECHYEESQHGQGVDELKRRPTPIDGMGVWYGRVEPRHVEGIVRETIQGGRVIGELLRGVHDFGGAIWK